MPLGIEVGLGPGDFVFMGTHPLPKKGPEEHGPPQFLANFYCGQTASCINMPLGIEVGFSPRGLCIRRDPAPQKGAEPPIGPCILRPNANGYTWIKMPLGTEVGLGPDDIVLDGAQLPLPQKGTVPPLQFSAHVFCGQTAGWIKMALDMDVALVQVTLCYKGTQLPSPKRRQSSPIFGPLLLWPTPA